MRRITAALIGVLSGAPLLLFGLLVLTYSADSRTETSIDVAGRRLDADLVGTIALVVAGVVMLASAAVWRSGGVGRFRRERSRRLLRVTKRNRNDATFDSLADSFANLYEQTHGRVRLEVVLEDLLEAVPELRDGGVHVLDIGGGTAEAAVRLARLGNPITLVDPSESMLELARARIAQAGMQKEVSVVRATVSEYVEALDTSFTLVLCHAVLNWVADPRDTLALVTQTIAPEGRLSLLYGNRDGWLLGRILGGDLGGVLEDAERPIPRPRLANGAWLKTLRRLPTGWSREGWGDHGVPLGDDIVREWLAQLGLVVDSKAGIRVFHDHLPADAQMHQFDELLELERLLRRQEPFASLGRLTHVVCHLAD